MTEIVYEWRVVAVMRQLGGIGAGTYRFPCGDETRAHKTLEVYEGLAHVVEAWIEKRPVANWERVEVPNSATGCPHGQCPKIEPCWGECQDRPCVSSR